MTSSKSLTSVKMLAALLLTLLLPLGSSASTLTIIDVPEGTFGGLIVNTRSPGIVDLGTAHPEQQSWQIVAPVGAVGLAVALRNINILEQGTLALSDTIQFDNLNFPTLITFTSDDPNAPFPTLTNPLTVVENGLAQSAGTAIWLNVAGGVLDTDTFTFQSDVERVPEPATLLLLASGLIGLAGTGAWRTRRKA